MIVVYEFEPFPGWAKSDVPWDKLQPGDSLRFFRTPRPGMRFTTVDFTVDGQDTLRFVIGALYLIVAKVPVKLLGTPRTYFMFSGPGLTFKEAVL